MDTGNGKSKKPHKQQPLDTQPQQLNGSPEPKYKWMVTEVMVPITVAIITVIGVVFGAGVAIDIVFNEGQVIQSVFDIALDPNNDTTAVAPSATSTLTPLPTATFTPTSTFTMTATFTSTATFTPTSTFTSTATFTPTATFTHMSPAHTSTFEPTATTSAQSTQIPASTSQSITTPQITQPDTQPSLASDVALNIPTGLAQFPNWSPGVYASDWLLESGLLTAKSTEVREQQNQYSFQIYIDSSQGQAHGYTNGGIYWDHDSATCKYVPLDRLTTVTIPAGNSIWGMAIDTTLQQNCS